MKNAVVVGFGVSGKSAARFLLQQGWQVAAIDKQAGKIARDEETKELIARGIPLIGEEACFTPESFQLAVISPGIPSDHAIVQKLKGAGVECIGEVELAFRYLKQPAVGITGTNGKTTVTLLVTHILQSAGKKAAALGNVGTPLASSVPVLQPGEIIVAELSSFQLEALHQKVLDLGVILNITPDHLDRYSSMESYAEAKALIFRILKPEGHVLVFEECLKAYPRLFSSFRPLSYGYGKEADFSTDLQCVYWKGEKQCLLPEGLKGKKSHDLENFLAAFALTTLLHVSPKEICAGFESFEKPRHRIEYVGEREGVVFYNDSKGTNLDAVVRAVESMDRPVLLIAGGVHKGASYRPWIETFKGKVKKIYAIGAAAGELKKDLSAAIPLEICSSLQEAVERGFHDAVPGDAVLLSPGCSSFDMFDDYAHRGEEFVRIVNGLLEGVLKP